MDRRNIIMGGFVGAASLLIPKGLLEGKEEKKREAENQFKLGDIVRSKKMNKELEGKVIMTIGVDSHHYREYDFDFYAHYGQAKIFDMVYPNWKKYPLYVILGNTHYYCSTEVYHKKYPKGGGYSDLMPLSTQPRYEFYVASVASTICCTQEDLEKV